MAWDDVMHQRQWETPRRPHGILWKDMSRRRLSDQLGLQDTDGLQQAKQDQLLSQYLLPKHMGAGDMKPLPGDPTAASVALRSIRQLRGWNTHSLPEGKLCATRVLEA